MEHPIVSKEEWLSARKALLLQEKEETHLRDAVNAARLALPWVRVQTDYVFDTPSGKKSLGELFAGRSQLIVYHFMLGPGWKAGCPGCSFLSDHIDGGLPHLDHHDVTWTAVSRAPISEIESYKSRMGWKFPWASSSGNSFNHDFHVSFNKDELARGRWITISPARRRTGPLTNCRGSAPSSRMRKAKSFTLIPAMPEVSSRWSAP